MKKSEMTCVNCVKFHSEVDSFRPIAQCRLNPQPTSFISRKGGLGVVDPKTHWCSQGQWKEAIPGMHNKADIYWGMSDEDGYVQPIYECGTWGPE